MSALGARQVNLYRSLAHTPEHVTWALYENLSPGYGFTAIAVGLELGGPILDRVPDREQSLAIWDAVVPLSRARWTARGGAASTPRFGGISCRP
mgnify:CR=1 FL=1